MTILSDNHKYYVMNKKFNIIPSKRGKVPSHLSSMMEIVKKVNELSILFSTLENCTINFHKFIVALWKLTKLLIIIILWVLFLISMFSSAL